MHTQLQRPRPGLGLATPPAMAELFVDECERTRPHVAIPRPQIHLVARLGPSIRDGLDVHALGVRQEAHRKVVPGGQRIVFARLHLHTYEAVLGVPASAIGGRIVALEDLWGDAATRRLRDRLAGARDTAAAAAALELAIAERIASAGEPGAHARLAFTAAERLASASVRTVARGLGVSERHLRRVFRAAVGVSPKAFAKLTRFHRALAAARGEGINNWATIAAAAGYYHQAHLIAEFHAIAGTTPRALLAELQATS
ncbi:AraC family transcriptional regulator [Luteimonas sp. SJ-92]|uniref:AraC family transcriptional regulator n=1 Tax=Luteimonas salinisoli TaxID=2752307 RepID=A0A853J734_9GAMM|nr:helix-turn-helix domain-containing protein [Luteimonas salinisoli]NZA24916.1 AraC family transcriptional regulator [Luteimonas salinisoli]